MKVETSLISTDDVAVFTQKLHELVLTSIDLPLEALRKYNETWNKETIREGIDKLVLVKATVKSEIIGIVLGTAAEAGVGTIIWVLVDSKFQSSGVGSQLLNKAFEVYLEREAHKVKLTVPSRKIVKFYELNNMKLEGYFPNHWYNHDFWQMGKELK